MRRAIGFLHVPKAAGSSVSDALRRAALDAGHRVAKPVMDTTLFGSFDDYAAMPAATQQMIELDPIQLADADTVVGHYSLASLRHGRTNSDIVCVLREPRARLLSLYTFWRSWTPAQHAAWDPYDSSRRAAHAALDATLGDPVLASQVDNVAARLLLAGDERVPTDGPIDEADHGALADEALSRLAALGHVDTVEAGDAGWSRISTWVGADLVVDRHNVTPPGASIDSDDLDAASAAIERCTAIDQRLWRAVVSAHEPRTSGDELRGRSDAAYAQQRQRVT
ncbi:MAG: hypothetical protein AAGA42_13170 [Actinomycetota bacterium]